MTVRKRGDIWYYDFMLEGIRYRRALPAAHTRQQARRAETQARDAVLRAEPAAPASPLFADFLETHYLPWAREHKRSYKADEWRARVLNSFFGELRLDQLTPFLIEQFKHARRHGETRHKRPRSAASVNRELELLSRILSLAVEQEIIGRNICRRVRRYREDNQRMRYLSVAEEERLMNVLNRKPRRLLKSMVIVALNTGMRRGEITGLKWRDLDFERGLIHVRQTKTGHDRSVPLNDRLRAELQGLRRGDENERIFEIDWIEKGWRAACREAAITDLRFHDLRHTCATRLAEAGTDAFTIAALLGHRNVQMTARYAHATNESLRRAVQSLSENLSQICLTEGVRGK